MFLTHVLLTRFSYNAAGRRADGAIVAPNQTTVNPLAPRRLEKRFKLFETFCLPSVLSQINRDFIWVLIIDPEMKSRDRARLRELTRLHARTHLVEYHPAEGLGRLGWLHRHVQPAATTHIATTNIDDDDLIGVHLVEYVQQQLRQLHEENRLAGCHIIACTNPPQWDLMQTPSAPLGYLKPWHRPPYPTFAGYTLCCRQPEFDLSALAFEHTLGAAYFDPGVTLEGDATQRAIRAAATSAGENWKDWRAEDHLHVVRTTNPQVVVMNHFENDQATRAFEGWSARRAVQGPSDFPEMAVAYDKVPDVLRTFRRSPRAMLNHVCRGMRLMFSSNPVTHGHRWQVLYHTLTVPIWFIRGLPDENRGRRVHQ